MNIYVFALSNPSDRGRHFVFSRFSDFPINRFNFNFCNQFHFFVHNLNVVDCLGLIDDFSAKGHAEMFASITIIISLNPGLTKGSFK